MPEIYKIFKVYNDEIVGEISGLNHTKIKRVYPYIVKGKMYFTTNLKHANRRNRQAS